MTEVVYPLPWANLITQLRGEAVLPCPMDFSEHHLPHVGGGAPAIPISYFINL